MRDEDKGPAQSHNTYTERQKNSMVLCGWTKAWKLLVILNAWTTKYFVNSEWNVVIINHFCYFKMLIENLYYDYI